MLVGDVRRATTGAGSSWKLSGGSMFSAGVTNVSKNLQVRLATMRNTVASASGMAVRPRAAGVKLDRSAISGETIHSAAKGSTSANASPPAAIATMHATMASAGAPAIQRKKAARSGV